MITNYHEYLRIKNIFEALFEIPLFTRWRETFNAYF